MRSYVDSKDLYEVLGVSRDATPEQIQAAYRELAKIHHPDVGGEPSAMAVINHAYDVLSDTFKRSVYDRGGDPSFDVVAAARAELLNLFSSLVDQVSDVVHTDLKTVMIGAIRNSQSTHKSQIAQHNNLLKRWSTVKERSQGNPGFVQILDHKIERARQTIQQLERSVSTEDKMIELLQDFNYTFEEPKGFSGYNINSTWG